MTFRAAWLLTLLVLPACQGHESVTPAALQRFHRICAKGIAEGSFAVRPSERIGIGPRKPAGTPIVIYGASWCVACNAAADYLRMERIPFVERDVEEDPGAQADSDRALAQAGLVSTHALPVIDVRGTVMIGFMPCVVDAAWPGA